MLGDARLDAVRIALAQIVGPAAVTDVELSCRVALDAPRELLQLDPEEAGAGGGPGRVDGQRLADHDRGLRRQEPAVRLVDGARDTVEPRRQVHDRGLREPFVAFPARWLGEREVDLHLGAAVAKALGLAPRSRRAARRRAGSESRCRRPARRAPIRSPSAVCTPLRRTRARRARPSRRYRPIRGCTRRGTRRALRRRRGGSAFRPPAPRPRSPAPCSPKPPRRGRARCAAPTAPAARARARMRTSSRASRAPR